MTPAEKDPAFESLLIYLRQSRGFDFTGYKRSTLMRRVQKRMQFLGLENYSDYLDYLEVYPDEFNLLFNTILINVTAFFRDASVWEFLHLQVLPNLIKSKADSEPIRIWSAGCASGEEAYTLAMLMVESLGTEQFRQRVKIYATDLDEEALSQSRQALYSAKDIQAVPPEFVAKYFEPSGNRYIFRHDLRRSVIFGRHDLLQDAPISRIDLLVCRNTLMYFNAEAQMRVLARFHFALNDTGYLYLGKAEMLLTHSNLFTPLNLKHRIFTKVSAGNIRDRLLVLAQVGDEEANNRLSRHIRMRELAFDSAPIMTVAQLLPMKLKNLDERSLQMLQLLESNAKRGADLVQQILSFARGSESKRTIVQPSELLEDIAQIIIGTFPKSINFNIDIAPDLLSVAGDATQLHQVLINLCLNARDAMLNGGDLSISAVNVSIDAIFARMHIEARVSSYVLITISDTGVGISPKIIDRIFDPFFTTKHVGKGTGLGLSIAMGIINSHGGFLDVFSEVELGSQFKVYLPSSDGTIIQPVDEMDLLTGRGELILVVDDEAAITQITKTTLEIHNYRVLTAEDGIEALALYTQYKQEIRVVLMDIMMPSMAGATAIRTLQRMNPQVQIIAMSGLVSAESLAQVTGTGIQAFLPKPFSAKELLNILQRVLVMG
ncbi:MAG: CheR family methyltransferase [Hassallia sp.]